GGLRRPKVPVGVGRDAEVDRCVTPACLAPGRRGFSAQGKGDGAARCGSEESPAGKFHSETSCKPGRDISPLKIRRATKNRVVTKDPGSVRGSRAAVGGQPTASLYFRGLRAPFLAETSRRVTSITSTI